MIQIPVFNDSASDFEQTITLGTQEIVLRIAWNSRSQFWFMDLDDQQGNVVYSRKLVPILPILYSHRASIPIAGDFVLLPEDTPGPEYPTFEGLGKTHNLYWLDADELVEWEVALGIS